ncbi:alanine racemase [Sarcina sp. DSM 11001]|uniref:alanine racemase n=1 Tax=Sarcina sp. DSM 11001 TaxID=1798184 RepID=UPI00089096C7|nr:alanine racemase [Sarcina sp. DSM 11001]SDK55043.1 alanine racemase [Sarcina sp. DSM 11001]
MSHERICAKIDLSAACYNMESMHRNLFPDTRMIAVVKTNGYGHGAVPIAHRIESLPYLWGFAVATFEEAVELRQAGIQKPVLILGYAFPYCYEDLAELGIRPACFREDMLEQLAAAGAKMKRPVCIHIAVDTGMSRIGITPDDRGLAFVRRALELQEKGLLSLEGIFTHFAKADETDLSDTDTQLERFFTFTERIEEELGYRIPLRHISNSAGIIRLPHTSFDLVRAGITLYGLWPSDEVPREPVPLRPVMSLHSSIVFIKTVPAGTAVSYGGTYVTKGSERLATIPVGYGDGYPRGLSGKGYVLIRGKKAPIRGRVCMDQMMVDVSDIPDAAEGDPVTLIGRDGDAVITMEELGDLSGRFNYELACCISPRVPRIFL